jgi:hypothetical protein
MNGDGPTATLIRDTTPVDAFRPEGYQLSGFGVEIWMHCLLTRDDPKVDITDVLPCILELVLKAHDEKSVERAGGKIETTETQKMRQAVAGKRNRTDSMIVAPLVRGRGRRLSIYFYHQSGKSG